jgi:hypothetical protein
VDVTAKQLDYLATQITRIEDEMIDPREFGRLEGAVVSVKAELDQVRARQATMDDKLDMVLEKLTEAKGGWRMLMLLGGAGASLGALITWFASNTFTIGPR